MPQRPHHQPTISVVVASRNDDHGGSPLVRTQLFLDGLSEQAARYRIAAELVLVEWNPPPDRNPLAQALRWPKSSWLNCRVITVDGQIHKSFANASRLPMFQMIAKNVGIRRSHGRFVVATNVDILFSDQMWVYLHEGLDARTVYRADRNDIDFDATSPPDPATLRAVRPRRLNRSDGIFPPETVASGRIVTAIRRLRQSAWLVSAAVRLAAVEDAGLTYSGDRWTSRIVNALSICRDAVRLPRLHTNACGDFTLLSRQGWIELRGYPEWEMFSMYLDGLFLFHAAAHGFKFVDLPPSMAVTHLDHESGSGWSPAGARVLFDRLDRAGVPALSYRDWRTLALATGRQPNGQVNLDGWGLAEEELAETFPAR